MNSKRNFSKFCGISPDFANIAAALQCFARTLLTCKHEQPPPIEGQVTVPDDNYRNSSGVLV